MNIEPEEVNIIVGALDSLAASLAGHGHEWTVGEREIYEQAIALPPSGGVRSR